MNALKASSVLQKRKDTANVNFSFLSLESLIHFADPKSKFIYLNFTSTNTFKYVGSSFLD